MFSESVYQKHSSTSLLSTQGGMLNCRWYNLTSDTCDTCAPQTPPRGLQLHLGTIMEPHIKDTLVMSNLAYFQLKAAPGM